MGESIKGVSLETASAMASHNCKQCHGRGYHLVQKPDGLGGYVTCTCVDKRLEKSR